MEYRILGKTGLKISRLGLGGIPIQRIDAEGVKPLLRQMIVDGIMQARQEGAQVCVLDMPLLYEKELDTLCDRVWCAWIPRETQLERLMARDGFTREAAEMRLASQMDPDEKARRANVVIDTSGSIQYTKSCVLELYAHEVSGEPC